jgi:hypothetical protein
MLFARARPMRTGDRPQLDWVGADWRDLVEIDLVSEFRCPLVACQQYAVRSPGGESNARPATLCDGLVLLSCCRTTEISALRYRLFAHDHLLPFD